MVRKRFAENDPMKDLHVPRWRRRRTDKGKGSNALKPGTSDPADLDFDRSVVRADRRVIPENELQ